MIHLLGHFHAFTSESLPVLSRHIRGGGKIQRGRGVRIGCNGFGKRGMLRVCRNLGRLLLLLYEGECMLFA